ncbi:unnamed protein product [Amaranthus hypochondriacus]
MGISWYSSFLDNGTLLSSAMSLPFINPAPYGDDLPQGPPRSSSGFADERPLAQGPPSHSRGYDYYGPGSNYVSNTPGPNLHSTHMPGHHTSGSSMAPRPHSHANYNNSPPRATNLPHPYSQIVPPAQGYFHGNRKPKYESQAPMHQKQ